MSVTSRGNTNPTIGDAGLQGLRQPPRVLPLVEVIVAGREGTRLEDAVYGSNQRN